MFCYLKETLDIGKPMSGSSCPDSLITWCVLLLRSLTHFATQKILKRVAGIFWITDSFLVWLPLYAAYLII